MIEMLKLLAPYWDGLWKHWRKPMLGATLASLVAAIRWGVNLWTPLPANLFAVRLWFPEWWVWVIVSLCLLAYAQFRMWADEHKERANDKEKADGNLATLQRDFDGLEGRHALEISNNREIWDQGLESKERDWRQERARLEAECKRLDGALSDERARHAKPDLVVRILNVWVMRDSVAQHEARGDKVFSRRIQYLTATFTIQNNGGIGTVDECSLDVEAFSGSECARSLLIYGRGSVSAALRDVPNVRRIERNVPIPVGETVTRYEHFFLEYETEIQDGSHPQEPNSSMYPDQLRDDVTLKLKAVDSYGIAWLSGPWPTPQPQSRASGQP